MRGWSGWGDVDGLVEITASSGRREAEDVVAEARHRVAVLAQRLRLREPSRRPVTVIDDQVIAVVVRAGMGVVRFCSAC